MSNTNETIIPENQIIVKKKIGKSPSGVLTYVRMVGGLHLILDKKGKIVSAGPHPLVARHLAAREIPDITWTELSKADHLPIEAFEHLLPEYQAITNELRKLQEE